MVNKILETFKKLFNDNPLLVSSPGRVNLIGEHTDYNDGFVLPGAIDKKVILALAPSGTKECKVYSSTLNQISTFNIGDIYKKKGWAAYVVGVVGEMQKAGYKLSGFNAVFDSDVPIGAGLSSSAALEGAFSFGLSELFDLNIDKARLARIGQLAEHNYAGVRCGIMDQFANLFGKKETVIKLDCRSLAYEYYPFHFKDYKIVLCNSMVHHALASSEYNVRRKQCELGVEKVQKKFTEVKSLRDVTLEMLERVKKDLSEEVIIRCSYVIKENNRVKKACELLKKNDLEGFGKLLFETHKGLSKAYGVSCSELDYLVMLAHQSPEVIGARMIGGGFGGCTLNIVQANKVENFTTFVKERYKKVVKKDPQIYITNIEEGVHLLQH